MIQFRGAQDEDALRQVAAACGADVGACLVVVFGSVARGEPNAEDLDIGVLAADPFDVVELTNTMTQRLGTQAVDVTDLRRADPVLLALVARDGVPLFEREPGEFSRFVSVALRRFADTRKFRDAQAATLRTAMDLERKPR